MQRLTFFRRIPIALLFLLSLSVFSGFVVAYFKPEAITMALYKLHVLTFAGLIGWWMDHVLLFPYARPAGYLLGDWRRGPHHLEYPVVSPLDFPVCSGAEPLFMAACYRRAVVVAGFVIAAALVL